MTALLTLCFTIGAITVGGLIALFLDRVIYPCVCAVSVFMMVHKAFNLKGLKMETSLKERTLQCAQLAMKFIREGVPPVIHVAGVGTWNGIFSWHITPQE